MRPSKQICHCLIERRVCRGESNSALYVRNRTRPGPFRCASDRVSRAEMETLSDEGWGIALTIVGFLGAFIIIVFAEYEEVSGQAEPETNGLDVRLWNGGMLLALMFVGPSFVAAFA